MNTYRERKNDLEELAVALPRPYLKEGNEKNPEYGDALATLKAAWVFFDEGDRNAMLFEFEQRVIVYGDDDDVAILFALHSANGTRRNAVRALRLNKATTPLDLTFGGTQAKMVERRIARYTRSELFAVNTDFRAAKALVAFLREDGHNEEAKTLEATYAEPVEKKGLIKRQSPKNESPKRQPKETPQERFERLNAVEDIQDATPEQVRNAEVEGLVRVTLDEGTVILTIKDSGHIRYQVADNATLGKRLGRRGGFKELQKILDSERAAEATTEEIVVNATPKAVEEAEAAGLDISTVTGSGVNDRVLVGDVREAVIARGTVEMIDELVSEQAVAELEEAHPETMGIDPNLDETGRALEATEVPADDSSQDDSEEGSFEPDSQLEGLLAELQANGVGSKIR